MKFLFRWLFRLLLLLLVLAVALVLLKDTITKSLVERRLREQTGLEPTIGRCEIGLLSPTITIQDFKLHNPPAFGGQPFIDLPELFLELDPAALTSGELHFKTVRMNLRAVNVVENQAGEQNTERLHAQLGQPTHAGIGTNARPQIRFTGIDQLNLTVGRVRFTSLKNPAQNWERDLGFNNEVATNIRNEGDLAVVLVKILLKHGLSALKPLPGTNGPVLQTTPTPAAPAKPAGKPPGRPAV